MKDIKKSSVAIISAGIILVIASIVTLLILQHDQRGRVSIEPTFDTILPNGQGNDTIKDWALVSPKNSEPAYAYSDMIDGVSIIVTQQILPESFKENPSQKVAEMAAQFNATNKVELGDNQYFFVGASAKGPQSVIFLKGNILVLIKSDKSISDASWKKYIESLS